MLEYCIEDKNRNSTIGTLENEINYSTITQSIIIRYPKVVNVLKHADAWEFRISRKSSMQKLAGFVGD